MPGQWGLDFAEEFTAASDDEPDKGARQGAAAPGRHADADDAAADSGLELGNVEERLPGSPASTAAAPVPPLLLFDLNGTLLQKEWTPQGRRIRLRPGAACAAERKLQMEARVIAQGVLGARGWFLADMPYSWSGCAARHKVVDRRLPSLWGDSCGTALLIRAAAWSARRVVRKLCRAGLERLAELWRVYRHGLGWPTPPAPHTLLLQTCCAARVAHTRRF